MNILWITNVIFPEPSKILGLPAPVIGGWTYGLASRIAASPGISLAVAAVYSGENPQVHVVDNIRYYLLPSKSKTGYQKDLEPVWQKICEEFKPDIIHIHGTEFSHGLACMRSCPHMKYVVSIQGLVSVYARYYFGGMCLKEILTHVTFRDIVRGDTIFQGKKKFEKRGIFEKEYLQTARHVIGRTSWDYAHVKSLNRKVTYHFCNESLRDGFYSADKWDIRKKVSHTIFLSQAYYPIKGAHQVLKAVSLLKKDFPDIQVRFAGDGVIKNTTLSEKLRLSGYGNYLLNIINKSDLHENVKFLGSLDESRMIHEYQNAHLFICPSSIENSPNSLGEAQLIGTPLIAAYVGGIPDMVTHGRTGLLYRFEEIEMLAESIRQLFNNDDLAQQLSVNGIEDAVKRHDKIKNCEQLLRIYMDIKNV
jgi:glycosyltransferase involved in cell wall biosynthesis